MFTICLCLSYVPLAHKHFLSIAQEIISHNCSDLVSAVPFFSEADPIFVSAIITKLRFEVFLEGDIIIQEGTIGTEMYFLREGTVEIRVNNDRQNVLNDGSYFGGKIPQFIFKGTVTKVEKTKRTGRGERHNRWNQFQQESCN